MSCENGKLRKKWESIIVLVFLLLIGTAVFLYWSAKKEVWFCDEVYSYQSANGFEQGWPGEEYGKWMSGEEVSKYFSADWDKLALDYIGTTLYSDHVPLYFWLFRLVSYYGFHGSASLWIGFSINLFFFVTLLILTYKVFEHLTKKPLAAGLIAFLSCVANRLILQQAMTLRMYMMLLWAEVLLLVTGFWILREKSGWKQKLLAYLALYGVSVFGFLTHYDFWIYYAVVAAVFCLRLLLYAVRKERARLWRAKEFWTVIFWIGNFVAALGTELLAFKYSRWNLFRDKGAMAMDTLFDFTKDKLGQIRWGYDHLTICIFGEGFPGWIGWLLVFGCIAGGAIVLYRKKDIACMEILLLSVAITQLYQLAVCFSMPGENVERYLWGSYTITLMAALWGGVLLAEYAMEHMPAGAYRGWAKTAVSICIVLTFLLWQVKIVDGGNGIIYLFHSGKDMKQLEEKREVPWIVYGPQGGAYSYYDFTMPEKICFLSGQETEELESLATIEGESEVLLYVQDALLVDAVSALEDHLGRKLQAEYLCNSVNMNVYLVK